MTQARVRRTLLNTLVGAALLAGCTSPIRDPEKLSALKDEARVMMSSSPPGAPGEPVYVPSERWPPTIASLKPELVSVEAWGVGIVVRPGMDGGWGYQLPREEQTLPMPEACYSEIYEGVFWHGPC